MPQKIEVTLTINGRRFTSQVEPRMLLSDFIRHVVGLKGTHVGCEHGVCGACTIMLDGHTARSCLHFAAAVQHYEITTVEGLAMDASLDPVRDAFRENHGLQCGYCTPGVLMTTVELLRDKPDPTRDEIRAALTNNMCRCTGYTNIIKSVASAASRMSSASGEKS